MILILVGPPGAGKGTQASWLQKNYGLKHISTGNLLRAEIASQSEIGRTIQSIVERGEFPSDEIVVNLLKPVLSVPEKGFVLDGFPRTLNQIKRLEALLKDMEMALTRVIEISVPYEDLARRLTGRFSCKECGEIYNDYSHLPKIKDVCDGCGGTQFIRRQDDSLQSVSKRLKVYEEQTRPILDYYKNGGLLFTIDGRKTPSELNQEISHHLSQQAPSPDSCLKSHSFSL